MKEVVGLYESKIDQQNIEVLKDLLAKAETGELESIMFVEGHRNGDVCHGWGGRPTLSMMGEVENLKFNFFSQMYFPVMEES